MEVRGLSREAKEWFGGKAGAVCDEHTDIGKTDKYSRGIFRTTE